MTWALATTSSLPTEYMATSATASRLPSLSRVAVGHQVDQVGLAEEVDVEAGGHGQGHRSDLADDDQPGRAVGQGHQGGARDGAARAAVGDADRDGAAGPWWR